MNWIRQNKKLAAILGVMIAGGLGLGAWLYLAWSDYSGLMDEWKDLDQKTSALENAKVYPSAANVNAFGKQISDFRDKFNNLRDGLLDEKLQAKEKPISETDFQAKLKERARAVAQKADKITDLPKDFALGFDEYTSTLPTSPEVAQQLNVQLDVMEKYVNTLLEAGVKSIDLLERTRLPTERAGAAVKAPPAPSAGKPKTAAPKMISEVVLDRYTIKCAFTCDQGPLQSVMSNLANPSKTPQFLAVRQLHVENTKAEAPTKDEVKSLIKVPAGIDAIPQPSNKPVSGSTHIVIEPPAPLPKDAAEIMGAEMIKVYMEVDYIRLRQPDDAAAQPKR